MARPFSACSGIARLTLTLAFQDGGKDVWESDDVLVLVSPNDRMGSRDASDTRRMLSQLLETDDNQAAEWMFAHAPAHGEPILSADESTDWSAPSLVRALDVAAEALGAMREGLLGDGDTFSAMGRDVLSFFSVLTNQLAGLREQIELELLAQGRLRDHVTNLVRNAAAAAGIAPASRIPTPPPLAALDEAVEREEGYLDDIGRLEELMESLDRGLCAYLPGAALLDEPVTRLPLPRRTGAWADDPTYARLWDCMRTWRELGDVRFSREQRTLHTVHPDVLFELYGLWRILAELCRRGFREDVAGRLPAIDRFVYTHAAPVDPNKGDASCANTYRLIDERGQRVTLWYQPVIFGDEREENGIALHRLVDASRFREPDTSALSAPPAPVYTPDYLLEAVRADGSRVLVPMDAKNMPMTKASGVRAPGSAESPLEQVQRKYLAECMDATTGSRASAVWIACSSGQDGLGLMPVRLSPWARGRGLTPCGVVNLGPQGPRRSVAAFLDTLLGS